MPPDDAAGPNPATVTATGEASDPAAPTGLTSAAAAERLRLDGPNTIGGSGRRTPRTGSDASSDVEEIQTRLKAREAPQPRFCWQCRKPLHARSDRCPFCGEAQ